MIHQESVSQSEKIIDTLGQSASGGPGDLLIIIGMLSVDDEELVLISPGYPQYPHLHNDIRTDRRLISIQSTVLWPIPD